MPTCLDCGAVLKSRGSIRCKRCSNIHKAPRLDLQALVYETKECINWPHGTRQGYALMSTGHGTSRSSANADRIMWEKFIGPLSKGLDIDHLCRNTLCVNLAHLEPVTRRENTNRSRPFMRRPTHCPRGHEFTPENTYIRPDRGHRVCRTCNHMPSGDPAAAQSPEFVVIGHPDGTLFVHHLDRGLVALVDDLKDFPVPLTSENAIFRGHALDRYAPSVRLYQRP